MFHGQHEMSDLTSCRLFAVTFTAVMGPNDRTTVFCIHIKRCCFSDDSRKVKNKIFSLLRMLIMGIKIFRKLIHHFSIWWAHHTPWQSEALLYPLTAIVTMADHGQQTSNMVFHVWPWSNNQWPCLTMVQHSMIMVDHGQCDAHGWSWSLTMVDDGIWWTAMVVHGRPSNTMNIGLWACTALLWNFAN